MERRVSGVTRCVQSCQCAERPGGGVRCTSYVLVSGLPCWRLPILPYCRLRSLHACLRQAARQWPGLGSQLPAVQPTPLPEHPQREPCIISIPLQGLQRHRLPTRPRCTPRGPHLRQAAVPGPLRAHAPPPAGALTALQSGLTPASESGEPPALAGQSLSLPLPRHSQTPPAQWRRPQPPPGQTLHNARACHARCRCDSHEHPCAEWQRGAVDREGAAGESAVGTETDHPPFRAGRAEDADGHRGRTRRSGRRGAHG